MIALLQRVGNASVVVDDVCIGQIDQGILALIGVQPDDNDAVLRRLVVLKDEAITDPSIMMEASEKEVI